MEHLSKIYTRVYIEIKIFLQISLKLYVKKSLLQTDFLIYVSFSLSKIAQEYFYRLSFIGSIN